MQIKELIINEEADEIGVDAISLVSNPAIESGFITLSKDEKLKLQAVDIEKLILCGPALIPNKKIYRKGPTKKEGYYIYFSKKTVRQASELFLKNNNQKNHTLEHKEKATGLTVVESWVKESDDQDKSNLYNLNAPVGTWLISVKCDNKEIYEDCKNGVYYGFSIEGFFSEKLQKHELRSFIIDDEIAIIDDRNAYSTKEKALKVAKDVGCNGYHEHNFEGKTWFMPCEKHSEQAELKTVDLFNVSKEEINEEDIIQTLKDLIKEHEQNNKKD